MISKGKGMAAANHFEVVGFGHKDLGCFPYTKGPIGKAYLGHVE